MFDIDGCVVMVVVNYLKLKLLFEGVGVEFVDG